MNHKLFSKIAAGAMVFTVYLIAVGNVFGCQCKPLGVCEAYFYAKAVFVGKAEKIEELKNVPFAHQKVTFSVERILKGKPERTEVAYFFSGSECGNTFEIGEKYFVYQTERAQLCNRTGRLSDSTYDLKYAESISEDNPVFLINGRIDDGRRNLTAVELKNTRITIEKGERSYNVEFDKYGNFDFKAAESGVYRVKIVLPFEAEIRRGESYGDLYFGTNITADSKHTTIEYDVEFKPNGCDLRWFAASKTGKIALLDLIREDSLINSLYENRRTRAVLRPV